MHIRILIESAHGIYNIFQNDLQSLTVEIWSTLYMYLNNIKVIGIFY